MQPHLTPGLRVLCEQTLHFSTCKPLLSFPSPGRSCPPSEVIKTLPAFKTSSTTVSSRTQYEATQAGRQGSVPACSALADTAHRYWIRASLHRVNSLAAQMVKKPLQCRRPRSDPWVGKILWRREWLATPVFLPGESHRQRSLAGYGPWGWKESDTTERLTLSLFQENQVQNLTCGTVYICD